MSPPDAAVSRFGPVVLRSRERCPRTRNPSLEDIVCDPPRRRTGRRASSAAPSVVARSRDGRHPDPDVLRHPGRPGDAARKRATYFGVEVRKSLRIDVGRVV
jgi:hypothetical protein